MTDPLPVGRSEIKVPEHRASWLELFFDLVVVVAVSTLTARVEVDAVGSRWPRCSSCIWRSRWSGRHSCCTPRRRRQDAPPKQNRPWGLTLAGFAVILVPVLLGVFGERLLGWALAALAALVVGGQATFRKLDAGVRPEK